MPGDISTMEGIDGLAKPGSSSARPSWTSWSTTPAPPGARAFDEFPESGWDKTVDLNMKTPFFLTQALIAPLRAAAKDHVAKVINICLDRRPVGGQGRDLSLWRVQGGSAAPDQADGPAPGAREHRGQSAIAPGAFASDMNKVARDHAEAVVQDAIPAGRIGAD